MRELNIIHIICCDVLGADYSNKSQKRDKVFRRWIFYKIARQLTTESLARIGAVHKKDHATVAHGIRNFDRDIAGSQDYRLLYEKAYQLSKARLHRHLVETGDKTDILLHVNINLRQRLYSLEKLLGRIPQTIKSKYI